MVVMGASEHTDSYIAQGFTKHRRTLSKPWSAPVVFKIIYSQRLAFWFFLAMKKEQKNIAVI
jgi:hypothetical protein